MMGSDTRSSNATTMKYYRASRMGRTAQRVLRPGARFRLLSSFATGVNLVTARRDLVFITNARDCAPWAVNVPTMRIGGMCHDRAALSAAYVDSQGALVLNAADVVIELDSAEVWEAPSGCSLAGQDAIHATIRAAGLPASPPGLAGYGCDWQGFWGLFDSARRSDALRSGDVAAKFIGLGSGLTPAGDDFLVGLYGTLALITGRRFSLEVDGRTSLISATQLEHALRGEVPQRLAYAIRSIGQADPAAPEAVRRVLDTGHTSGADMLAGVRLGFEYHFKEI